VIGVLVNCNSSLTVMFHARSDKTAKMIFAKNRIRVAAFEICDCSLESSTRTW
jgi:hypothetical protein